MAEYFLTDLEVLRPVNCDYEIKVLVKGEFDVLYRIIDLLSRRLFSFRLILFMRHDLVISVKFFSRFWQTWHILNHMIKMSKELQDNAQGEKVAKMFAG